LWLMVSPGRIAAMGFTAALVVRCLTAFDNQRRLTRSSAHWPWIWLAPVKDLLQVALWALAFLGNGVEWRGERYRVKPTGELVPRT
ncbi:MAG: bacteriohopanetetrol glucosamine biosynthesis glycosyltransferase HpnI, partial [Limisphaerales bacterium]